MPAGIGVVSASLATFPVGAALVSVDFGLVSALATRLFVIASEALFSCQSARSWPGSSSCHWAAFVSGSTPTLGLSTCGAQSCPSNVAIWPRWYVVALDQAPVVVMSCRAVYVSLPTVTLSSCVYGPDAHTVAGGPDELAVAPLRTLL